MPPDLRQLEPDVLAGVDPPASVISRVAVHTLTRTMDAVACSEC